MVEHYFVGAVLAAIELKIRDSLQYPSRLKVTSKKSAHIKWILKTNESFPPPMANEYLATFFI